ncbi:copper chaperone CopZ [Neomicrococcus aestuarii]|jgi:copper chaperone CopZ|uniref:Copper chaperone CopZ n=1 Tax=Neomicrococcus aestuarii TaxID=556325 RepID=A0A7W8TU08_9MICC|nr:heavy-metal-associated domain-containing protein [Neomicrococcus aestuarii]MBB5512895.1 copper chaperone CopZ [Neomicrococcus aestuarii]
MNLLPVTNNSSCSCCSPKGGDEHGSSSATINLSNSQENTMSESLKVSIDGMTCGHCVASVTEEISSIEGVEKVDVDLNAGGISTATITSSKPIDETAVGEAVAEAGYTLVSNNG